MHIYPELARDNMRKRGLAESGRSREQHVVEHFRTSARRGYRHPENFLGPFLPNEFRERARPQREVELAILLDADPRCHPSLELGRIFRRIFRRTVGGTKRS